MKKYFALYKASPEQFKKWMTGTPEEQKRGMEVWGEWIAANKAHIADEGSPLSKVKKVTPNAVEDAHNDIGGYMVLQAESLEEAATLMKSSPHFMGAEGDAAVFVEVMEMPSW